MRRLRPARPATPTRCARPPSSRACAPPVARCSTKSNRSSLLAAYGIPVTDTRVATTAAEARAAAETIGFPVAVKLYSRTITHKTDVGGVKLDLESGDGVARAFEAIRASVSERAGAEHFLGVTVQPMARLSGGYELILGASLDQQFGPVLLFGAGGQLVEVFRDRALALPPLNRTLARRMMEQTRIYRALQGVRGQAPVPLAAIEGILVRFSDLVVENPWIKEVDINPLLASPEGLLAVDARVVLHDPSDPADKLPRPAIRPYPTQYVKPHRLPNGAEVLIRPIRPEDEQMLIAFHRALSETSVRQRYMAPLQLDQRTTHERLIRVCFSDYDRDIVLVVENRPAGGDAEIVAVGRLEPARRDGRRRVRPAGSRRLAAAWPRDRAPAAHRRHRARRANPPRDRHHAARQYRHDSHLRRPGLHGAQRVRRQRGDHGDRPFVNHSVSVRTARRRAARAGRR